MIKEYLKHDEFDINIKSLINDTPLLIACENKRYLWVLKELVKNEKVDVNAVNMLDMTPLSTCIERENFEGLKFLMTRKDLDIRKQDKELAKKHGINLKEYMTD